MIGQKASVTLRIKKEIMWLAIICEGNWNTAESWILWMVPSDLALKTELYIWIFHKHGNAKECKNVTGQK